MQDNESTTRVRRGVRWTALWLCLVALVVASSGVVAAQTAAYDPSAPYKGMTVTASEPAIQDGEFYELRIVDEFAGGTVNAHSFVEELQADGTEIRIETDSLDLGEYYFVSGPGLAAPSTLSEAETFELREQTLDVSVGDDSDDTATSDDAESKSSPARYYGSATIDGEPVPIGTTVEAEVDGEVRGSLTVETAGVYGDPDIVDEQLIVTGTSTNEGANVSFYLHLPGADRRLATQSTIWESDTTERLNLSIGPDHPLEEAADDVDSVDTSETASNSNQTATEEPTETTETTPGFGFITAIGSLAVICLRRFHSTRIE